MQKLSARWKQHVCNAKSGRVTGKLQNRIRKYGPGAFIIKEIYFAVDAKEMYAVEKGIIAERGLAGSNGLNMSSGGESGSYGVKKTEAQKKHLAIKGTGRLNFAKRLLDYWQARAIYNDPRWTKAIADDFNVGTTCVGGIKSKKIYKDATFDLGPPPSNKKPITWKYSCHRRGWKT